MPLLHLHLRRRLVAATPAAALALGSLFLLLLLNTTPASAGGWRGRPHRAYTEADYHLNHSPVPTLSKDRLPREFSWANARGRHLLVKRFFFLFFLLHFFSFLDPLSFLTLLA